MWIWIVVAVEFDVDDEWRVTDWLHISFVPQVYADGDPRWGLFRHGCGASSVARRARRRDGTPTVHLRAGAVGACGDSRREEALCVQRCLGKRARAPSVVDAAWGDKERFGQLLGLDEKIPSQSSFPQPSGRYWSEKANQSGGRQQRASARGSSVLNSETTCLLSLLRYFCRPR